MLTGGACAYALAQYFSHTVLDQWLYDSAISLANRVKWEHNKATVDLPEGAREILEWDVVDRVFYEVISERGERLIGNAVLPAPPAAPAAGKPVYYHGRVNEAHVRVLAVASRRRTEPAVIVKVAETRLKRNALASQVLWISVALSIVLAAVSAAVIWYGIGSGMASMEKAVRDVRAVHAAAPLSPIALEPDFPRGSLSARAGDQRPHREPFYARTASTSASSPTPRTSCERRSRACACSSSSRCASTIPCATPRRSTTPCMRSRAWATRCTNSSRSRKPTAHETGVVREGPVDSTRRA